MRFLHVMCLVDVSELWKRINLCLKPLFFSIFSEIAGKSLVLHRQIATIASTSKLKEHSEATWSDMQEFEPLTAISRKALKVSKKRYEAKSFAKETAKTSLRMRRWLHVLFEQWEKANIMTRMIAKFFETGSISEFAAKSCLFKGFVSICIRAWRHLKSHTRVRSGIQ